MADEEYFQNEEYDDWKNENGGNQEYWDDRSQTSDQGMYHYNGRGQETNDYDGARREPQPSQRDGGYRQEWSPQQQTTNFREPSRVSFQIPQHTPRKGDASPVELGTIYPLNVGFGQTLYKMPREAWGALRPLNRYDLSSPISKIRFTQTGTPQCNTHDQCMKACRDIQKYYMDLGFSDIPWNFMIGGDGVLYHGRGWMKQADRPQGYSSLRRHCLDIAYIGKFDEEAVPYEMLSVSADFLKYGLKVQKITPLYQVYSFIGEKHANLSKEEF